MANKIEIETITQSKHHILTIRDDIEKYEDYDDLFKILPSINRKDSVTLKISSPGGCCAVGFSLFDRINALECLVEVIVTYPSYSIGAILALCGDSLTLEPGAFLMFHDYSTGTRGKGNEISKNAEAYGKYFNYKFNAVCQPFLTKKECEKILNGQDLYIYWDDDNLNKRLERHFK